jgi:hypothetical protein
VKKSTLITHLPTLGRILTPVAMLVALTYEIVSSQANVAGGWIVAIHIGAAATAVGIEAVGIMAGHVLEGFWRMGDRPRTAVAFGLLLIYTAAGLFILRNNAAMLPIPVIAAVVYLLAGLAESLTESQAHQVQQTAVQEAFELEQLAKDKELERELRRKEQADHTAVQLAKIEVKAKTVTNRVNNSRSDAGQLPGDFRLLTRADKRLITTLTTGELEEMAGISDSTARRWKRQVAANGHLNGATK